MPSAPNEPVARGISDSMRDGTAHLHRRAEETGIVKAILSGCTTRCVYAAFLRNLVPVYRELETGLERHAHRPKMSVLRRHELVRSPSLEHDAAKLVGDDWEKRLPLLPEGARYAERVAAAAQGDGTLLVAHAYTRYLGDLGGGPLLKRHLARTLHLEAACLTFYEFPAINDLRACARDYRASLDAAVTDVCDRDRIVEEAVAAFRLNIDLSEAILDLATTGPFA
jgi:heme oxygenase